MSSTFDRDSRKAIRRLDREAKGIREALQNCLHGRFKPEDGGEGLDEVLEFVRYDSHHPQEPFDPDMLEELAHEHQLHNPQMTILHWMRLASQASKIKLEREISIAVCDNRAQAHQVMSTGPEVDIVLLIYRFHESDRVYTNVACKDEESFAIAQLLFPDAEPAAFSFGLYLRGAGEKHRDAMLNRLPANDMWSYNDFRYQTIDGELLDNDGV